MSVLLALNSDRDDGRSISSSVCAKHTQRFRYCRTPPAWYGGCSTEFVLVRVATSVLPFFDTVAGHQAARASQQGSMKPGRERVSLRGYERTLTMVDGVSTKIVHSMLVRGPTTVLLRYLATAVMNTFNMHPRMRALQLKSAKFMAEIHPPLTRHDVTSFALVRVRMVSSVASDVDDMMSGWQHYADDECSIGFDRFNQLPFFLTVWVDEREGAARLMLFSDSYMSDGYSGMVVLNCILEQVAMFANEHSGAPQNEPEPEQPPHQVHELPLRTSLYKMWLSRVAWAKPIVKSVVSVSGRQTFRDRVGDYKPLLSARAGSTISELPGDEQQHRVVLRGRSGVYEESRGKMQGGERHGRWSSGWRHSAGVLPRHEGAEEQSFPRVLQTGSKHGIQHAPTRTKPRRRGASGDVHTSHRPRLAG